MATPTIQLREAVVAGQEGRLARRAARSAVSKSLRTCLRRIENAHPALGAHLATAVRTGYFCSYKPEMPIKWQT